MNVQGMADAVVVLVKQLWNLILFVAQRYWVTVIAAAVVVTLLATAYSWLRDAALIRYTLLDGPAGGTGRSQSAQIAAGITARSSPISYSYAVESDHTNGYEENYHRISKDMTGRIFGFALDGFDDGERVRVLLPLEKTYLHIIARREFIDELKKDPLFVSPPGRSLALSDVYTKLKPGRVFLGPKGSGTHQAARLVLGHYVSDPERFQSHGLADWNDMRAAFHTGTIDLAFYSGPLGADAVTKVARDGTGTLLDLGDDAETICQTKPHLGRERILKNSYANGNGFCTHNLQSLTMRRVLISSIAMNDRDAWFLAENVNITLRPSIGDLHLQEHAKGDTIRYLPHDGALAYWKGGVLSYLPPGFNYFLLTVGLAFLVEIVRFAAVRLQNWVRGRQPDESSATEEYVNLFDEVEELQARAEAAAQPISAEHRASFSREVRELRRRIEAASQAGRIADNRRDSLLAGLRATLRIIHREDSRQSSGERPALEPTGV